MMINVLVFCCLIGVLEHLSRVSCCQEIMIACISFPKSDSKETKNLSSNFPRA